MRIVVLTTDTLHHRYFLRQLARNLPDGAEIVLTVFETRPYPWRRNAKRHLAQSLPNLWNGFVKNPYLQPKSFARRQDAFEMPRFFPDGDTSLPDEDSVERVQSVNLPEARELLSSAGADVFYVYGTGKIRPEIFDMPPLGSVNAHGGKLPGYRGLDTNLWAAYEGRPKDMYTTVHEVSEGFDEGSVYLDQAIAPHSELSIYSLRYFSTLNFVDLFRDVTLDLLKGSSSMRRHDPEDSNYYGPIPWVFKRQVETILRNWVPEREASK